MRRPTLRLGFAVTFATVALAVLGSFAMAQEAPKATTTAATTATATSATPTDAPAPVSSASAAAPTSTEAAPMDGATYKVKLRDLEQRVDELKEQIRRSHMRLSLLSDTILSGAAGGARAEIEFSNDYSGAWRLVEAVFVLDGAVQYKKADDTGALAAQKKIPIVAGSIPTGDHVLQVQLKLRGHGYGVFSYLRGVEALVKDEHAFTITDGKVLELKVVGWEQGGPTTPLEEQPAIRFTQTVRSMSDTQQPAPAEPAPAVPAAAPAAPAPQASSNAAADSTSANAGVGVSGGK